MAVSRVKYLVRQNLIDKGCGAAQGPQKLWDKWCKVLLYIYVFWTYICDFDHLGFVYHKSSKVHFFHFCRQKRNGFVKIYINWPLYHRIIDVILFTTVLSNISCNI